MQRPGRPLRELQRPLERIARMHGLAMGDDRALERKLEHRAQVGQRTVLVSGGHPYPQHSGSLGQRVGEDQGPVFGKPERRLVPASGIPEREQATGKLVVRQDRLHVGLGRPMVGIENCGTECPASIAADHGVHAECLPIAPDAAHVIRTEYRHGGGRPLGEAVPNLPCIIRR